VSEAEALAGDLLEHAILRDRVERGERGRTADLALALAKRGDRSCWRA
jgi:hypothetical protein